MKSIVLIIAIFPLLLASCNESSEKVHIRTVKGKTNKKLEQNIVSNTKLSIEISGMSCEKGCGGTIRKALKQTGGVDRVSYDFVEGRDIQIANITLDSNKVDLKKIKNIISDLNENQFKTGKTEWKSIN